MGHREREWKLHTQHHGTTSTIEPDVWIGGAMLLVARRSIATEFRVVISGPRSDPETRNCNDVLCFAIGQNGDTMAALGCGNPHVRRAEAGYRHCNLPKRSGGQPLLTFWILCDPVSGWVALGAGDQPTPASALLTSRMSAEQRPWLATLSSYCVSNWDGALTVHTRLEPAKERLIELHPQRAKFDSEGRTIQIYGLTAVCELPQASAAHLIMSHLRDALASEPALAGSYGLLPPSSYHMTVFDIISSHQFATVVQAHAGSAEAAAASGHLPRVNSSAAFNDLPLPMRLYATSMALRLERAGVLQSVPWTSFAMRAVGLDAAANTVVLEPWDDEVAIAIENWRARVAECTGTTNAPIVRSVEQWNASEPRVRAYCFHMTIAYVIFPLGCSMEASEAQRRLASSATAMLRSLGPIILRTGMPHFCHSATSPRWLLFTP